MERVRSAKEVEIFRTACYCRHLDPSPAEKSLPSTWYDFSQKGTGGEGSPPTQLFVRNLPPNAMASVLVHMVVEIGIFLDGGIRLLV